MNNYNYLLKYDIVAFISDSIKDTGGKGNKTYSAKYCNLGDTFPTGTAIHPVYIWKNTAALFAYFCYIVTEECAARGLNIYKGQGKIDVQRFRYFFPTKVKLIDFSGGELKENKEIDRKLLQEIISGYEPKGAEDLKKLVQKNLQKFFI